MNQILLGMNQIQTQITNQETRILNELSSFKTEQQNLATAVSRVTERVEVLEKGRGHQEALLNEIRTSETKIFIRTRSTFSMESFNGLLEGLTQARVVTFKTMRAVNGWNNYSASCLSAEERNKILIEAATQIKNQNGVEIKRDTPLSYKKSYAELQNAGALLKKATADETGEMTMSTKIVFQGIKCVLQARERAPGGRWTNMDERGPDQESTVPATPPGNLAELGRAALVHERFEDHIMRGYLQQVLGRSPDELQITSIRPGRSCTKIVCMSQEAAKAVSDGLTGKSIPGTTRKFSCSFIPIAHGHP